ncbi:MAG: S-layer homology domain-containing protein, partial [Bacillota bacterium]|nr:S-layer homology domain-containing protein [Bacillota bacterium]
MKKTIIILTVILILGSTSVFASNFSDVKGDEWYTENLEYVTNPAKKIIDGYPDGTFRPNNKLTVEEFIALILKGDGIKYASQPNIKWSTPYIEKAKEEYLIEDNQFTDYSREITREEMAEIVSNYLRFTEKVEYNQKTY